MDHFWKMGYSAEDIVSNVFKVCKNHTMDERLKLKFVKVKIACLIYVDVQYYINFYTFYKYF